MIFFDATGKRWRKIKLSAAGMAVAVAAPVGLLGVGAFVYQPQWGHLPIISQAHNFVDEAASLAGQQVAAATHPSGAQASAASSKSPTPHPVAKATAGSTPAPTSAVLSAQTLATPRAIATPAATPAPTAVPGNSSSHPTPASDPTQSHRTKH